MAEILHQLRLVFSPIIYKVLYIPDGAGFLPSTVTSVCLFRGEIWALFFSHLCLPDSWSAFPAALSCMRLPKAVCLCGSFEQNRNWTDIDTFLATAFQDNQSDKELEQTILLTNLYKPLSYQRLVERANIGFQLEGPNLSGDGDKVPTQATWKKGIHVF